MLYHRMKGHPELDCIENCAAVCHECHMEAMVNGYKFQEQHWARRKQYGFDMRGWNDGLKLLTKEKWE